MTISRAALSVKRAYMSPAMPRFLNDLTLTERALAIGFVSSAVLLAGAHLFERVGGLYPCILCLDQREAHWAALGVSAAGLFVSSAMNAKLGAAAAVGALSLVYAVSAGLAFYHTGVEYGFWPGPAGCSGAGLVDLSAIAEALNAPGAVAPACDEVQWRFFFVSMAGYNLLASAGLFALTFLAALSETRMARMRRLTRVNESTA
ncbi:MAG: disulfide bond formation protein B [Pseudomonadota bacterium]